MGKFSDKPPPTNWTRLRLRDGTKNGLIAIIFGAAFLSELWHFLRLSWFFLHLPPITGDAHLYFAVGRSLLNGSRLYFDLFESKPPIIFWLTELSLGTGHPTLYIWIQMVLLLSLAPVLAFFVYRTTKGKIATACALLLGMTAASDLVAKTLAYQPEGFGAPLAIFSVLFFVYPEGRRSLMLILSGVAMGIAALTKEPFVCSAVLGILVFCRSKTDLLRLLATLCIGAAVAILVLTLSGALGGYFSLYLPEMFSGRAENSILYPDFGQRLYYVISAPMWIRALNSYKLFTSMAVPAQAFLYPGFFLLCLGLFAPLAAELRARSLAFSFTLIGIALFCGYQAFILYELISVIHLVGQSVPWGNPLILRLLALLAVPILIFVTVWESSKYRPPRRMQLFALAAGSGLFLTAALATYGGNYDDRYIGFVIPPLVALSMYCLTECVKRHQDSLVNILTAILVLNAFVPGKVGAQIRPLASYASEAPAVLEEAKALDALMNSCGIDRYFSAQPDREVFIAFTKHSPYQITYGQKRALGGLTYVAGDQTPNPYFAEQLFHDLQETKIVVALPTDDPSAVQATIHTEKILNMDRQPNAPTSQLPEQLVSVLRDEFTTSPPPCAAGLVPIDGIKVFFRHS